MDLNNLTVNDCVEMAEKEKMGIILHAGKVTEVIAPNNKGIQTSIGLDCTPTESKHL